MHQNNLEMFKLHGLQHFQSGYQVLEIGPETPGGGVCRGLVTWKGCHYHFADLTNQPSNVVGLVRMIGEYTIRSPDSHFDIVFSLSVAEHVRQVWTWMKELTRIVKPGGLVITTSPISWPFHKAPHDCWRIYPEGYKALFEFAGLEHIYIILGTVAKLEDQWEISHGPQTVVDSIAIGRKPL